MSTYPGAIDEFRTVENLPGITYDAADTKTIFADDTNGHSDAITAIETTLGVNPQADGDSVADRLDNIDADIFNIRSLIYPIGTIYTNATNSANPSTYLGFGTWEAFGQGRVLVGKATSGTFGTAGSTGGAETHTLTTSEMPSHTHDQYQWLFNGASSSGNHYGYGYAANTGASVRTDNGSSEVNSIRNANTGGGGAHNNLQPYVVVYMWKRTA